MHGKNCIFRSAASLNLTEWVYIIAAYNACMICIALKRGPAMSVHAQYLGVKCGTQSLKVFLLYTVAPIWHAKYVS